MAGSPLKRQRNQGIRLDDGRIIAFPYMPRVADLPSGWRHFSAAEKIEHLLGMTLDDMDGILSWPIAELDPFRLSVRLQVMRLFSPSVSRRCSMASSTATLPASAIAIVSSKSSRSGSTPGCGTAPRPRPRPQVRGGPGAWGRGVEIAPLGAGKAAPNPALSVAVQPRLCEKFVRGSAGRSTKLLRSLASPTVMPPPVMVIAAMIVAVPPAPGVSFGRGECASKQECDERADDDPHDNSSLHRQQPGAIYSGAG
jgi:hypothetical protein